MPEDRILFEYIADKMLDYEEPQRSGTPKGDKIGFPANKYLASLFFGITNYPQKEIAKLGPKNGIRYGVLRNWSREGDFKAQARIHALEFAIFLLDYIEGKIDADREIWNDYFDCRTDEKPPRVDFSGIDESARRMSAGVINGLYYLMEQRIAEVWEKRQSGQKNCDELLNELVLIHDIDTIAWYAGGRKPSGNLYRIVKRINIEMVKSIVSSKRVLSKSEQRLILHALEILEKEIMEESKRGAEKVGQEKTN